MKLAAFVLILVCCIWTLPEAGKIYEWTDENGVKHFSEEPPPKGENIVKKIETIPSDNASDQKPLQEETGAVKKDMQQQEASTSQAAQAGSSGSNDSDDGDITDNDEEANLGDPDEKANMDDPDEKESIDDPDEKKNIGDPEEKKDFEEEKF